MEKHNQIINVRKPKTNAMKAIKQLQGTVHEVERSNDLYRGQVLVDGKWIKVVYLETTREWWTSRHN